MRASIFAIGAAALGNLFLLMISVEANYGYGLGISEASPFVRLAITATLAGALALRLLASRRSFIDPLVIAIFAYIIVGGGVGFLKNGITYEYARHGFAAGTMLVAYWLGIACSDEIRASRQEMARWAWITAIFGVAALIASIPAVTYAAYSLSPGPVLLALDAGIATKSVWLLSIVAVVVLLGNKRAVLLGTWAIVSTVIVRRFMADRPFLLRLAVGGALAVGLTIGSVYAIRAGSGTMADTGIDISSGPVFERVSRVADALAPQVDEGKPVATRPMNPSEMTPLDMFTSGRVSQFWGVVDEIDKSAMTVVFGGGFGSSFLWSYWSDNLDALQEARLSQVDFMPLWFLLTGGVLFALAIPALIAWRLLLIYDSASKAKIGVGALFVLGVSLDMLLSFQPNAPLFWIMLGAFGTPVKAA